MFLKTSAVFATVALVANSFLIPPAESLQELNLPQLETLAATLGVSDPRSHVLKLDCPGCPWAQSIAKHHKITWASEGVENSLVLNFAVGPDSRSLLLNGAQFYPPSFGLWPPFVYVPQVRSDASAKVVAAASKSHCAKSRRLLVSGYTWHFAQSQSVPEDGAEIIPMSLTINSIEGFDVNIPTVVLKVIKDAEGNLMIVLADADPVANDHGSPDEGRQDGKIKKCNQHPRLCKWKAMAKSKLQGLKGAFKKGCRMHRRPKVQAVDGLDVLPGLDALPGQLLAGSEHHHHKAKKFFRAMWHGVKFVLVPALIGIAAGCIVYILGAVIGLFFSFLWAFIAARRAGRRGLYAPVEQGVKPADYNDVKDLEHVGLLEEEVGEAPPMYKDTVEKE